MRNFLEWVAVAVAILLSTAGIILLIDFVCFWIWIASGQVPQDSFYLGTITEHIIRLFL